MKKLKTKEVSRGNMDVGVQVTGPYFAFSSPYGKPTLDRDEWFVNSNGKCIGRIVKFMGHKDYVIDQLFPRTAFRSLKKAVDFLVENNGKLVFCT
jgi:hypothetical protein